MGKWYNNKKAPDFRISEEAGRQAVLEFVGHYDIEFEETGNEKDDRNFDKCMDALCGCYRMGLLENRQDEKLGFCVIQHVSKNGQDITYREMRGEDRLVHGKYDAKTQTDEKVNAILGKLSGNGPDLIMKLMGQDRKAAVLLGVLFFGV
jgi:hypothetical protein